MDTMKKKNETCGIKYKHRDFLNVKDLLIGYKYLFHGKNYQKKFDDMHIFYHDIKFRKCVYQYEYMDDWKKSSKT